MDLVPGIFEKPARAVKNVYRFVVQGFFRRTAPSFPKQPLKLSGAPNGLSRVETCVDRARVSCCNPGRRTTQEFRFVEGYGSPPSYSGAKPASSSFCSSSS